MTPTQLSAIIACGEDSRHQFKRDFTNAESLAAELAAFANMGGGMLLVGVGDDGKVAGLASSDISRLNQLLSNAASQHVKPPINPTTTNVKTPQGLVMLIEVTAREEMQRIFQQAGLLHADEQAVSAANLDNIDQAEFAKYFERRYGKPIMATGMPLERLLPNLNLICNGHPNLACMLLFGNEPHHYLPAFIVKAVALPGTVLHDNLYIDNENIEGTLAEQYERGMAFFKRNLRHVQGDRGFNSPGQLEIPPQVLQEILVNALVHRDYLISATIRLIIFVDRVEIISPGHLPNHLTTEQIRFGLSNLRNPALASHAFHILPYQGMGSGILRAIEAWPQIEFIDERAANQFRVVLKRPDVQQPVSGGVNGVVNGGVNALAEHIRRHPGLRTPALAALMKTAPKNVERWLKQLRQADKIVFVGSPKTGGYQPK